MSTTGYAVNRYHKMYFVDVILSKDTLNDTIANVQLTLNKKLKAVCYLGAIRAVHLHRQVHK